MLGKLSVSFGFIDNILEEKFDHNCISEYSVGSAVLNINTKKIIGMDSSKFCRHDRKMHYMGYFINYFIKEFIQLNYYKKQYKEVFTDKNNRVVKFDKYIPTDKFNLTTKFLGNEVHEKLNYLFHDYGMKYYSSLNYYGFDYIQRIIEQMKNCVCKIKIGNIQGTGFFCKIPFPKTDKIIYVMITSNYILKEDILYSNNNIELNIGEANEKIKINLDNRVKYTSEKYNITIIEINKNDNIKNFLEFDEFYGNVEIMIDKSVYIIQYPEGNLSITYGQIIKVLKDKIYNFSYSCLTKKGSSGSPIIYYHRVIGLHLEENINDLNLYLSRGTFLKYPIEEYIQYYSNTKKFKIINA